VCECVRAVVKADKDLGSRVFCTHTHTHIHTHTHTLTNIHRHRHRHRRRHRHRHTADRELSLCFLEKFWNQLYSRQEK